MPGPGRPSPRPPTTSPTCSHSSMPVTRRGNPARNSCCSTPTPSPRRKPRSPTRRITGCRCGTACMTPGPPRSSPRRAAPRRTRSRCPPGRSRRGWPCPLPAATKGAAYSKQLAATGGTTPYTWSVGSGALPAGVSLSAAGLISGTPTVTGTFTFNAHVADSAAHTDDQVLTLTVGTIATSGEILFGANSGNNYLNGTNGTHSGNWETVRSHLATTAALQEMAFGYRDYGPTRMPTSWNDGINVPAAADFSVLSWKPNIDNTLAGMYDAAITQWGVSSQKKWNANPGSIFQSLWHEGDSLNPGSSGNPTSQQILRLHAYVFPRFVAACKSVGTPNGRVPYGQMFIGLTTKNSPSSWVSCKATVAGGSDLDWYGLDIYSHGGDPTADTMFTQSANNILALAPNSRIAVTECNSYNADAITYFSRLFTLCQQKNALFYLPFFNGCNNGDTICFSTTDSTRPGENAALRTILGQCAAAGAVTISKAPPA